MRIRVLDEVVPLGSKGVLLFTESGEGLAPGSRLLDARGKEHTIAKVEPQEEWMAVLIENGDGAYFERLFRDIRVDATAFEVR